MQRSIKVQREYSSYVCRTSIQCHYRPTVFSFAPGLVSITLRKNQTLKDLLEPSMCDWKWSTKVAVWVKPWVCVCGLRASAPAPGRAETGVRLHGWAVCLWCSNEWLQGWSRTEDCSLPGWTSHHETARTSYAWTRDSSCRETKPLSLHVTFYGIQCNGRNVSAGRDCAVLLLYTMLNAMYKWNSVVVVVVSVT